MVNYLKEVSISFFVFFHILSSVDTERLKGPLALIN